MEGTFQYLIFNTRRKHLKTSEDLPPIPPHPAPSFTLFTHTLKGRTGPSNGREGVCPKRTGSAASGQRGSRGPASWRGGGQGGTRAAVLRAGRPFPTHGTPNPKLESILLLQSGPADS